LATSTKLKRDNALGSSLSQGDVPLSRSGFPRHDFERFLCSYSKLFRVIRVAQAGNIPGLITGMEEREQDS
jgi:hypothetical protein